MVDELRELPAARHLGVELVDEGRHGEVRAVAARLVEREREALGGSRWDTSSLLARLEARR